MTTISFDEHINMSRNHFKTLEEFQLYMVQRLQESPLSDSHKKVIDERLLESQKNPQNFLSFEELKSSIKRF